jgi:hypothetical protein
LNRQHTYSKVGWLRSPLAQDAGLVIALTVILALHPEGALAIALGAAIPAAIAWSLVTLHLPSRVDVHPEGIAFLAYGREHCFAWRDIERIYVRRFVVRDRVLVRIEPSTPLRGRYWLMDSLEGYDALVRTLEEWTVGAP